MAERDNDASVGHRCRACGYDGGTVVLDLGNQPPADLFPPVADPGPDPSYPLQMWLCARCALAQLTSDATTPEEPLGVEPRALVTQANEAVAVVHDAGWIRHGASVAEYGSPHGGSWKQPLVDRGAVMVTDGGPVDVVLDCFGLMHAPDQAGAVAERAARLRPDGGMLVQFHSLATIMRHGQWNSLRHGHFAYYSMTSVVPMLAAAGLHPRTAWTFDLYSGTVLLAATRAHAPPHASSADPTIAALMAEERALGVDDPERVRSLEAAAVDHAEALRSWLEEQRAAGRSVWGYGAASRAVALLCRAGIDRRLIEAVADASTGKQGRRMPATDIPVMSPDALAAAQPDEVAVFVPDLVDEMRIRLPQIEQAGGTWVDVDRLAAQRSSIG